MLVVSYIITGTGLRFIRIRSENPFCFRPLNVKVLLLTWCHHLSERIGS